MSERLKMGSHHRNSLRGRNEFRCEVPVHGAEVTQMIRKE